MRIIADTKIPFAAQAFSALGEVCLVDHRELTPKRIEKCDILLTRSETRVDETLLSGSAVKFVGSPTSGVDHISTEYLASRNIGFASAPGGNARSVAEYILAALLSVSQFKKETLRGKTLGLVGFGNIGKIVAEMADTLKMEVLLNDPPLRQFSESSRFVELNEICDADYVSTHVPLTRFGEFSTFHLFDKIILNKLRPDCVLINSSRGSVVDNRALLSVLKKNKRMISVLDVWENEPEIDFELLNAITIGTPHIAGYSWDGKIAGTRMVFEAASRFFDIEACFPRHFGVAHEPICWSSNNDIEAGLREVVPRFYDIMKDHKSLQMIKAARKRGSFFADLRKKYPIRRQFSSRKIKIKSAIPETEHTLKGLGFCIEKTNF